MVRRADTVLLTVLCRAKFPFVVALERPPPALSSRIARWKVSVRWLLPPWRWPQLIAMRTSATGDRRAMVKRDRSAATLATILSCLFLPKIERERRAAREFGRHNLRLRSVATKGSCVRAVRGAAVPRCRCLGHSLCHREPVNYY